MQSQSWQTDLLNLQLTLTVKPMFKYVSSLERLRQMVKLMDDTVGRLAIPRGTRREAVKIPGAQFEAEWVLPDKTDSERVLLYLPGGAYVIRMPNAHTGMVSRLCRNANARALMAYYRLAPEYPFPACLEDSVLAYRWLLRQGVEPGRIVIAGDSAGGGLTLAAALRLRELGVPLPDALVVFSPWVAMLTVLVLKSGWRDGWRGWVIAGARWMGTFAKYAFLLERQWTKPEDSRRP